MDGSQLLLYKDDSKKEVFLVRRNDFPIWQMTGGGIEENESKEEAAVREAIEETGFEVKLVRYLGVFKVTNIKGDIKRSSYVHEGRVVSGKYIPEFVGCLGEWFPVNRLPYNVSSHSRKVIKTLSEEGVEFPVERRILDNSFFGNFHLLVLHPFLGIKFLSKRLLEN